MNTLFSLSKVPFSELLRKNTLLSLLLFALLLGGCIPVLNSFGINEGKNILIDLGIALFEFMGILFVLSFGSRMFSRKKLEADRLFLHKPISRKNLFFSKYLGFSLFLFFWSFCIFLIFLITISLGTDLVLLSNDLQIDFFLKSATIFLFGFFSFLLLLAVTLFFHSFFKTFFTVLSSLFLFILGHIGNFIITFSENTKEALTPFFSLVPPFSSLNIKNTLFGTFPYDFVELISVLGITFLWIAILLTLGSFFFSRKSL